MNDWIGRGVPLLFAVTAVLLVVGTSYGEPGGKKVQINERSITIQAEPAFTEDNVKAYFGGSFIFNAEPVIDAIVFSEGDQMWFGPFRKGWKADGFVYGMQEGQPEDKILLFKLSGRSSEIYFDVRGQKQVYPTLLSGDRLVISDTPPRGGEQLVEHQTIADP